jgi:hypothetical protein
LIVEFLIPDRRFENLLCSKVFEGDAAYQELIRSSEGNPRDFLRLLANCCPSVERDAGKAITERAVLQAAISHFQNDKQPEISHDRRLTAAFDELFNLVTSKGSKLFAVSSTIAEQSDVLRELWHYRFIHLVQPRLPKLSEGRNADYDVYAMDYGKLLSLKRTREGEKLLKLIEQVTTKLVDTIVPVGAILADVLKRVLKNEKVGGTMRETLGRWAIVIKGVERGSLDTIDDLITAGCVADDILSQAEVKSAPRKERITRRKKL